MKTSQTLSKQFLLAVGFGWATAFAGSFQFDFNSDPSPILNFCGTEWDGATTYRTGSSSWVPSGGAGPIGHTQNGPVAGVAGDGFLRLTFASPDCGGGLSSYLCGGVLFNDFDVGLVVAGFTFECDLRIGNGSTAPADGFSISYVRNDDPVLLALAAGETLPDMNNRIGSQGGQFSDNGNGYDPSLMEEGTQTGLSIGFDMWSSGDYAIPPIPPGLGKIAPGLTHDNIGLDIRVDGTLVATIPMPNGTEQEGSTIPGAGDDPTSIATGPYDGTRCDATLAWVHFKAVLDTAGVLNVWYKNTRALSDFTTQYYPSPGRLLMAARVGAFTANIEVDNVQITTIPASEVLVGPASGTATGFSLSLSDSGPAVADPDTVQVRLNGAAITPTVSKTGGTTTINYSDLSNPFPPGTTNTVTVSLKQTNGLQVGPVDRTYVVPGLGTLKWASLTGGPIRSSPAIGRDGTLYVGSSDNKVYALDRITGALKWTYLTGGEVQSSPAVGDDGTLYVGSNDGRLYALDAFKGIKKWSFVTGGWVASPVIGTAGTVYVGSGDGKLYALDTETGAKVWDFKPETGTPEPAPSSLAVGPDGIVYVLGCTAFALDGRTGAMKWQCDNVGCQGTDAALALGASGILYVSNDHDQIMAVDGATGSVMWSWDELYPPCIPVYGGSPAIGLDGTVYTGSGCSGNGTGGLKALDGATHVKKWTFADGYVSAAPAIAEDGTVYFGADRLYALDGATGSLKWDVSTGAPVGSSPTIGADGTVYVCAGRSVLAVTGSAGLASSPWPKFRHDAQNTGRLGVVPRIVGTPSRVVLIEGATGRIKVRAAGEPLPSFRWFLNDNPIPGATEATLTIPSVTRAAEGSYTVMASNGFGQVTSDAILALVSNVDPESFVGLKWEGGSVGPISLEATVQLGKLAVWHSISNYPSSTATQQYVEMDPGDIARFYRLNAPAALEFSAAGWVNGWWITEPAGTRVRIEMVSAATGWTAWQELTALTLPATPHLFLDLESLGATERVYRTTVVP